MSYNHLTWYNTFQGSTWAEVLDKWASGDIPNIPLINPSYGVPVQLLKIKLDFLGRNL